MKKNLVFLILLYLLFVSAYVCGKEQPTKTVPVKGMVTMVDVGAATCIPCKMMAPILEKLEKRYKGRAAIIFIDVRYDYDAVEQFGVRMIPTQIFFDMMGREFYRHAGFMSEAAIVDVLRKLGVNEEGS